MKMTALTYEQISILQACTPGAWIGIPELEHATSYERLHVYANLYVMDNEGLLKYRNAGTSTIEVMLTDMGLALYIALDQMKQELH